MASTKAYLNFVLEQCAELQDGLSFRAMMGEYVLYYQGKVVGGVYDDRFLLKRTETAVRLMPGAVTEIPYEGAKAMLVADIDHPGLTCRVIRAISEELPAPKRRKR